MNVMSTNITLGDLEAGRLHNFKIETISFNVSSDAVSVTNVPTCKCNLKCVRC